MKWGERPVIIVGNGLRCAGYKTAAKVLELNVPVLSTWQAADLLDNNHPNFFGRPGLYGNRTANWVLENSDHVISLGSRLSIWTVGYEPLTQRITAADVDADEWRIRYPHAEIVQCDAGEFLEQLRKVENKEWLWRCDNQKGKWLEWHHKHGEYLNSYACIHRVGEFLKPDSVVVTEMGAALCGAFQVLKVKPPQLLLTSGGLGEMGCGLPYAVGASFARDKGEVIALLTDGGAMLNLQELATIQHHKLPIKMFLFDNRGYSMIRHTQDNYQYEYCGTDAKDLTLPDFRRLAHAWGFAACDVRNEEEFEKVLPQMFESKEPCLAVIHIDPLQKFWPKLEPIKEGETMRSPKFSELTPRP